MGDIIDSMTEHKYSSLRDHFLIAMPSLNDSIFGHTITYICDHSKEGSMGIVINQALDINLDEVFRQLGSKDLSVHGSNPVLCGGPVQAERGFVLHSSECQFESTMLASNNIALTASRDVLDAIAAGQGPEKHIVALGYAGWTAGQLEEEIADNAWLVMEADSAIIFDTPLEQRWSAAAQQMGFDFNLISSTAGHA